VILLKFASLPTSHSRFQFSSHPAKIIWNTYCAVRGKHGNLCHHVDNPYYIQDAFHYRPCPSIWLDRGYNCCIQWVELYLRILLLLSSCLTAPRNPNLARKLTMTHYREWRIYYCTRRSRPRKWRRPYNCSWINHGGSNGFPRSLHQVSTPPIAVRRRLGIAMSTVLGVLGGRNSNQQIQS